MESHMSQIDDVNFNPPPMAQQSDERDEVSSEREAPYQNQSNFYQPHQQPQMFNNPQQMYHFSEPNGKKDIFTDVDKSVYIIIFIAFILGFFMGKTMQPVILRPM
jgi:hypothetical protein